MLTLYIHPDCDDCQRLREKLSGKPLAHAVKKGSEDHPAHTLDDNGEIVSGHSGIDTRIDELEKTLQAARRYQNDACHDYGDTEDTHLTG
ncbi:MAG: hypothetical protein ACLFV7_04075 [Phycisphaerae bacterium]